jgi:hypothetical protein
MYLQLYVVVYRTCPRVCAYISREGSMTLEPTDIETLRHRHGPAAQPEQREVICYKHTTAPRSCHCLAILVTNVIG